MQTQNFHLNIKVSPQRKNFAPTKLQKAKAARPHPFDTKKVEVDFSKKSIFMDFRGKKK